MANSHVSVTQLNGSQTLRYRRWTTENWFRYWQVVTTSQSLTQTQLQCNRWLIPVQCNTSTAFAPLLQCTTASTITLYYTCIGYCLDCLGFRIQAHITRVKHCSESRWTKRFSRAEPHNGCYDMNPRVLHSLLYAVIPLDSHSSPNWRTTPIIRLWRRSTSDGLSLCLIFVDTLPSRPALNHSLTIKTLDKAMSEEEQTKKYFSNYMLLFVIRLFS